MHKRLRALRKNRSSKANRVHRDQNKYICQDILKAICEREFFTDHLTNLILSDNPEISIQGLELTANLLGEDFYQACVQELVKHEVIYGQDIPFCLWVIESIYCSPLEHKTQVQILAPIESICLKDNVTECDLSLLSSLPQLKTLSVQNLPNAYCENSSKFETLTHFSFDMFGHSNQYLSEWIEQVDCMTALEELTFKHDMSNIHWRLAHHQSLTKLAIEVPYNYKTLSLDIENCPQLNKVHVDYCSHLSIKDCVKLNQLTAKLEIDDSKVSINSCPQLEILSLENSKHTNSFSMHDCPSLTELNLTNGRLDLFYPHHLNSLKSLKLIDSDFAKEDLQYLSKLEDLTIEQYRLSEIKFHTFTRLKNLTLTHSHLINLDLSSCTALESLHVEDLYHLSSLHLGPNLKVIKLHQLKTKVVNLERLKNLQRVDLSKLSYLESLTLTSKDLAELLIENCPHLAHLELDTHRLQSIALHKVKYTHTQKQVQKSQNVEQPALQFFAHSPLSSFKMTDCGLFDQIFGLDQTTNLNKLCIKNSNARVTIEDLGKLTQLKSIELDMRYATNHTATDCSYFSQMTELRTLSLKAFKSLKSLQGLERLKTLECLELRHCSQLHDLSAIENSYALQSIYINNCSKLKSLNLEPNHSQLSRCTIRNSLMNSLSIRGLARLSMLDLAASMIQDLQLNKLQSLQGFSLPQPNHIKHLRITAISPQNLDKDFKRLEFKGPKLESLVLTNLSNLESLVCDTPNLSSLMLSDLNTLHTMHIASPTLKKLQLEDLSNLKELGLLQAGNLKLGLDWHRFDKLNSLELSEYKFLERLEQLSPLKDLQKLTIKKIETVNDLQQIYLLFPQLQALSLPAFMQYKSVVDLRKLTQLKTLFPCRLWRAVGLRKSFNSSSPNTQSQIARV